MHILGLRDALLGHNLSVLGVRLHFEGGYAALGDHTPRWVDILVLGTGQLRSLLVGLRADSRHSWHRRHPWSVVLVHVKLLHALEIARRVHWESLLLVESLHHSCRSGLVLVVAHHLVVDLVRILVLECKFRRNFAYHRLVLVLMIKLILWVLAQIDGLRWVHEGVRHHLSAVLMIFKEFWGLLGR